MNILIVGVPGFNRGDDAILLGLLSIIRRSGACTDSKSIRFFTQRQLEGPDFTDYQQIIWNRRSITFHLEMIKSILWADVVVLGGGSIIQDKFGAGFLKGITGAFAEVAFFAKLFKRRVITAPIGVDRLDTEAGMKVAGFVLRRVDRLFVRDMESKVRADSILSGEKYIDCLVLPDPALALIDKLTCEKVPGRLVLCPAYEGENLEGIRYLFQNLASLHISRNAYNSVVFLAMDERVEEDAGAVRELSSKFSSELRVSTLVPRQVDEVLRCLREAEIVISMRLHPLILSLGNTYAFSVSRGPKMDAFVKGYGLQGVSYVDASSDPLSAYNTAVRFHKARSIESITSSRDSVLDEVATLSKNLCSAIHRV